MSELLDFVNEDLETPIAAVDHSDTLGNPIAPEIKKIDMEHLKALHADIVDHWLRVAAVEHYKSATAISRNDAEYLSGRFPDFAKQFSIESFTMEPTRLNLKETLRYTQEEVESFKMDEARKALQDAVISALYLRTLISDTIQPRIESLIAGYKDRITYDAVLRNKNLLRVSRSEGKEEVIDLRSLYIHSNTLDRISGLSSDLLVRLNKLFDYIRDLQATAMVGALTQTVESNLNTDKSLLAYRTPAVTVLGMVRLMTNNNAELFQVYLNMLWNLNDDLADIKSRDLETAVITADLVAQVMSKCSAMNRFYDEFQIMLSVLLLCEPIIELVEM